MAKPPTASVPRFGPKRGRGGPGGAEGRLQVLTSWPLERKRPGGRGRGVGERGGCGAGSGAQQRRSRGLVGAVPASLGQRKARGRGRREAPSRRRAPFGFCSKVRRGGGGNKAERLDVCCCPRSYSYSVSPLTPPYTPPSSALPPSPRHHAPGQPQRLRRRREDAPIPPPPEAGEAPAPPLSPPYPTQQAGHSSRPGPAFPLPRPASEPASLPFP